MNANLMNVLKAAWFTPLQDGRWGLVMILKGEPGTAKTARLGKMASTLGFHMEARVPALDEPTDYAGMPVPDLKAGVVRRMREDWADRAADLEWTVVFIDEANQAPQAVQAACLKLVHEAKLGSFEFPETVRFVLAANDPEDAGGFDLISPLANRCGHLDWDAFTAAEGLSSWADYMLGTAPSTPQATPQSPAEIEASVMRAWPAAYGKAAAVIVSYMRSRPGSLHSKPKSSSPAISGAWPSRRSWENATRAMASAEIHGLTEEESELFVASFVGTDIATEFFTWLTEQDLPDPADILDGKVAWGHDAYRLDRTMAVMTACAACVRTTADTDLKNTRAEALWVIMEGIVDKAADLLLDAVRTLMDTGHWSSDAATRVFAAIQPQIADVQF